VSKSKFGITIWKAHDNIVLGNTLKENTQKGICLKECDHNTITSNNFIGNPTPASFFYSSDNVWDGNYWGRPRIFPKLIFGKTGKDARIPVINIDHHPLKEPYKP
jgi:parallel beta-helix repeat protein